MQRGDPRSVPEAPALCCGKACRLPYRERRAIRPPERNACRQRLQRLEVGASLAFILARVAHGQQISFGVGDRIRFGGSQCGSCNMVSSLKVPLGNLQECDALGRVNDLSGEDLMCLNGSF